MIFLSRGSCLTRTYTTTFALYIVGVLRKYHTIFLLNLPDVVTAFEQLNKIAYRPKFPLESGKTMLDCNSAEWCILNYLYDLASNCSTLKTSERYLELKRHFPSVSFYFVHFFNFFQFSILSHFHFCPFFLFIQFSIFTFVQITIFPMFNFSIFNCFFQFGSFSTFSNHLLCTI